MAQRAQVPVLKLSSSLLTFHCYTPKNKLSQLARLSTLIVVNDKNMSHGNSRPLSTLQDTSLSKTMALDSNGNDRGVKNSDHGEKTYQEAIAQLNTLQSNAEVIRIITSRPKSQSPPAHSETLQYLHRAGLSLKQLDSLKVIHIAGTKGKGSTCAFVESILRQFGLRTGLFSSPHLVSVRERIRINGEPLNRADFTKYFFQTYEGMIRAKKHAGDMPAYFRFLTCMAYYVFYHENVDVAIMEVGIGGTHDATNIVRKPVVVGITSLGLDHQNMLGNTLEEITLQKAGIMKPNVPAFTASTHPPHILDILKEHANKIKCPLFISPPLHKFNNIEGIHLGINGPVSHINAALALLLSDTFLAKCFQHLLNQCPKRTWEIGSAFWLTTTHIQGLEKCRWDGRFQILKKADNLTYYLDGAHTVESLGITREWFLEVYQKDSTRVLVFHVTGDRNVKEHLAPFSKVDPPFQHVVFCPLSIESKVSDNWSLTRTERDLDARCKQQAETWSSLVGNNNNSVILGSVTEVVEYLDRLSASTSSSVNGKAQAHCSVLVTGSLYLVGGFLSVLRS